MSNQITFDLDKLMKMNLSLTDRERADDVRQFAAEYILKGKDLGKALRYARRECKRMFQPTAFVSIDERADEDDFSLHERIAAADTADVLDALNLSRKALLDDATEAVLDVARQSAKVAAKAAKCCIRTAKYKRKQQRQEYSGELPQMPLFQAEVREVLA